MNIRATAFGFLSLLSACAAGQGDLIRPAPPIIAPPVISKVIELHVIDANSAVDPERGLGIVRIILAKDSAKEFGDLTQTQVGRQIEIYADDELLSEPVVTAPIFSGDIQITGIESIAAAHDLAVRLKAGKARITVQTKG